MESEVFGLVEVVLPHYLELEIENQGLQSRLILNNYLTVGESYSIHIRVHDRDGHRIYNTNSMSFEVTVSTLSFTIVKASPNNDEIHVLAMKEGDTVITAVLSQLENPRTGNNNTTII